MDICVHVVYRVWKICRKPYLTEFHSRNTSALGLLCERLRVHVLQTLLMACCLLYSNSVMLVLQCFCLGLVSQLNRALSMCITETALDISLQIGHVECTVLIVHAQKGVTFPEHYLILCSLYSNWILSAFIHCGEVLDTILIQLIIEFSSISLLTSTLNEMQ